MTRKNHTNFANMTASEKNGIEIALERNDWTRECSDDDDPETMLDVDEEITDKQGCMMLVCDPSGLCGVIVEDENGYVFFPVLVDEDDDEDEDLDDYYNYCDYYDDED